MGLSPVVLTERRLWLGLLLGSRQVANSVDSLTKDSKELLKELIKIGNLPSKPSSAVTAVH
jgi:hypothetical protein